jgi:hypothetical protein
MMVEIVVLAVGLPKVVVVVALDTEEIVTMLQDVQVGLVVVLEVIIIKDLQTV